MVVYLYYDIGPIILKCFFLNINIKIRIGYNNI